MQRVPALAGTLFHSRLSGPC